MPSPALLTLFCLALLTRTINCSPRSKYGEPCNKALRCETSSFLTCKNAVCDCYRSETMYYDSNVEKCRTLVGEKCRYHVLNTDHNMDTDPDLPNSHRNAILEELNCVENAWCNSHSDVCMCSEGYIELSNGTCLYKRNFEESCTSDDECREDRFLSCLNGSCGCNETLSTYNSLLRQCVGKAGQPCIGGLAQCVYNAECTGTAPRYGKRRTRQNIKICTCNPGFLPDPSGSGFCNVGLLGHCTNSKPCASNFKCKDGQCVCKFENLQMPMVRSQTCLSLVGGPCSENPDETYQCVENAHCALTNNNTLYECKCNEGFVENKEGTCDLAFGEHCSTNVANVPFSSKMDSNIDANGNLELQQGLGQDSDSVSLSFWRNDLMCDRAVPLFCINGRCMCESEMYIYDQETRSCLGKYGAKCKTNFASFSSDSGTITNARRQCISGAECVSDRDADSILPFGKCRCSPGFFPRSDRICVNVRDMPNAKGN